MRSSVPLLPRAGVVLLALLLLMGLQQSPKALAILDKSKTYFLKDEDRFNVATQSALNLHDYLPVGSYTVGLYPTGQYYLKEIQPFDLEGKKLYGDTIPHGQRILDTFRARKGSTGVLLAGEKGSGKTLLAKYISFQAAKEGISTIVINEAWSGERFNSFIQSIQQPAIVLFDEFEKVYRQAAEVEMRDTERQGHVSRHRHRHDIDEYGTVPEGPNPSQDAILTLLDGVYPSNMLFLLTVNDKTKITKNMKNRPGRIYYVLDFEGLETDFIREYCEDNLKNTTHVADVVSIASMFGAFSFDMLQAMVQEMNLYSECPQDVLKWMNIKLEGEESRSDVYLITELIINGKDLTKATHKPTWSGSPTTAQFVELTVADGGWMGSYKHYSVYFSPQHHMVSGNITSGEFRFEDKARKSKAVLVRSARHDAFGMTHLLAV